jgi:hypothetical protein
MPPGLLRPARYTDASPSVTIWRTRAKRARLRRGSSARRMAAKGACPGGSPRRDDRQPHGGLVRVRCARCLRTSRRFSMRWRAKASRSGMMAASVRSQRRGANTTPNAFVRTFVGHFLGMAEVSQKIGHLAERVGFEPTVWLPAQRFSRPLVLFRIRKCFHRTEHRRHISPKGNRFGGIASVLECIFVTFRSS